MSYPQSNRSINSRKPSNSCFDKTVTSDCKSPNPPLIEAFIPGKLESKLNLHGHWSKAHRTAKRQRENAHWAMIQKRNGVVESDLDDIALTVTITRLSPHYEQENKRLDNDNLAGACKAIRDGIADWLNVNDRDPRITWVYAQGFHEEYACTVSIAPTL